MAKWIHGRLDVPDEGRYQFNVFGKVEEALPESPTSWEQMVAALGKVGWEMVQAQRFYDSDVYWFKFKVE